MKKDKLLKQLVQIKSYSGQERKLAGFILAYCKSNNLPVLYHHGNIIIHLSGKDKTQALIFNAHMDTVKAGSLSLWRYPPFGKKAGVIKKGKLYGLGASDAKASIASFILLAQKLKTKQAPIDVFFTFVTSEETDGSGTKRFLSYFNKKYKQKYKKTAAILGEPTNLEKIEHGHKGSILVKITTFGDSGHAGRPEKIRKHALKIMIKVVQRMETLERELKKKYSNDLFGSPSLCLTSISTPNESKNKVPTTCSSIWNIRTTPQLHSKIASVTPPRWPNGLLGWWDDESKAKMGKGNYKIEVLSISPYGYTEKTEKIVKLAREILPKASLTVSPASNDLCFFQKEAIPAIVLGPGVKTAIHKENEYAKIQKVYNAVRVYRDIICNF